MGAWRLSTSCSDYLGTADSDESITEDYNKGFRPVALAGRVPVKVSFENGDIKKGDYLTSSSMPGKATKAIKQGRVIGIAFESATKNSGKTQVMLFINPHWAGQELDANGQLADFSGQPGILGDTSGIITSLINYLKDAILQVKELVADKISTKNISTDSIQLKDSATGDVYCVRIVNGDWQKTKGNCDSSSLPVEAPALTPTPIPSDTPNPSEEPTPVPSEIPAPTPSPESTPISSE